MLGRLLPRPLAPDAGAGGDRDRADELSAWLSAWPPAAHDLGTRALPEPDAVMGDDEPKSVVMARGASGCALLGEIMAHY